MSTPVSDAISRASIALDEERYCGVVARGLYHLVTGKHIAFEKTNDFTQLTKDSAKKINAPIKQGNVRVVAVLTHGLNYQSHCMVFVLTPDGVAHTLQAYFPFHRKQPSWSLSTHELVRCLRVVSTGSCDGLWTQDVKSCFDKLTHVSCTDAGKGWLDHNVGRSHVPMVKFKCIDVSEDVCLHTSV